MPTRWTSAIFSRVFTLNIGPPVRSNPAATVRLSAQSRPYASADKSLSADQLEKKKQDARMCNAEKLRLRYQSDPEYREKKKQAGKKYYAANATNPAFLEAMRQRSRQRYATDSEYREAKKRSYKESASDPDFLEARNRYYKEKYATDPEYREAKSRYFKEKYANDLVFREKMAQRANESWQERKSKLEQDPDAYKLHRDIKSERTKVTYWQNSEYRWSSRLRDCIRSSARFRDEVVWKHHELASYPTKTNHRCATCNHTKYNGLKLWYVSILETWS